MKVITKTFPVDAKYITLYPIGDVHLGAKECMEKEFKAYLKQIEDDSTAVAILVGDLLNNGIKSSVTSVYDEVYTPHEQKLLMVDLLYPIRDKILTGVFGNHEYRTTKETSVDVMEDVFYMLGIPERYAGDAAFVKLQVGRKTKNKKPCTYMLYVSHGSGGGALLGSGVSRQDGYQMTVEGIDISITGHTHKPAKIPSARNVFDPYNNKITRRNTLIFVCTSWLDYGGYPVQQQLKPAAFYPDTIILSGVKKEWK